MKLNVKAFTISFGIVVAALFFGITLWYSLTGFAAGLVEMLNEAYGGLSPLSYGATFWKNFQGIALLTIFGFADGALIGIIFSALYNVFIKLGVKESAEVAASDNTETNE